MRRAVALGTVLGLALLTKAYFLALLPPLVVLGAIEARRKRVYGPVVAIFAVTILISGWWYVRNWVVTHSISGEQLEAAVRNAPGVDLRGAARQVNWLQAADFTFLTHIWLGNWSFLVVRSWMYHFFALIAGVVRRLEELPDDVVVYPGHVAGSLCGASMSSDPSSTIGNERRSNVALRIDAVDDFVADALSKNAPRPPNMDLIVALNRGPFVQALPPLSPAGDVRGATVLDVRDAEESAAGHLPGALNVPLSGNSFATKSAFVLGDGPVVVHARSAAQAQDAARALRAVGLL